jgi:hypothetical protein
MSEIFSDSRSKYDVEGMCFKKNMSQVQTKHELLVTCPREHLGYIPTSGVKIWLETDVTPEKQKRR